MAATTVSSVKNTTSSYNSNANYTPALIVLTSLFFMWGFMTCRDFSSFSISGFSSTLIFLLLAFINYIAFNIGKTKPGMTVTIPAICAAVLVVVSMLTYGCFAMYAILAAGLFNSIMFPIIFTLAINGPGKHTGKGSGIFCTAIPGGAIMPVIQGAFAGNTGIQRAFFLPGLCYL